MTGKIVTLDELFSRDEEERFTATQAEIAAEKAAHDALTPEEKAAKHAADEARWDAMNTPLSDDTDEEDPFDTADGDFDSEDSDDE